LHMCGSFRDSPTSLQWPSIIAWLNPLGSVRYLCWVPHFERAENSTSDSVWAVVVNAGRVAWPILAQYRHSGRVVVLLDDEPQLHLAATRRKCSWTRLSYDPVDKVQADDDLESTRFVFNQCSRTGRKFNAMHYVVERLWPLSEWAHLMPRKTTASWQHIRIMPGCTP
jgi:hypothetical protein